jgi:hypothetical protein
VHKLSTKEVRTRFPHIRLTPLSEPHIWSAEQLHFLKTWFPHWGTNLIAKELHLTAGTIKQKADVLSLRLLPRQDRVCYQCRHTHLDAQVQNNGVLCKQCRSQDRSEKRRIRINKNPLRQHSKEIYDAIKIRNKKWTLSMDFDSDYLMALWTAQQGRCFYTDFEMTFGKGCYRQVMQDPYSLTVDRIDSSLGYFKDNIVLACWWANCAKNNLSTELFLSCCEAVVNNTKGKLQ